MEGHDRQRYKAWHRLIMMMLLGSLLHQFIRSLSGDWAEVGMGNCNWDKMRKDTATCLSLMQLSKT